MTVPSYPPPLREVDFGNEKDEIRGLRELLRQKDERIAELEQQVEELTENNKRMLTIKEGSV